MDPNVYNASALCSRQPASNLALLPIAVVAARPEISDQALRWAKGRSSMRG